MMHRSKRYQDNMTMELSQCFLQLYFYISLMPFLHGVYTKQYFSWYTIPHLMRMFVIEVLMLTLHIWNPNYPFVITKALDISVISITFIENLFKVQVYDQMGWTIHFFLQHIFLRQLSNKSFEILTHLVNVLRMSWISQLPVIQSTICVFCNSICLGINLVSIILFLVSINTLRPAMLFGDKIIKPEINTQNRGLKTYAFNKTHMTLSRFLGEDVLMSCRSHIQGDHNLTYDLMWTFNETTIQPTHKNIYSSKILRNNNISNLAVMNITAEDYGNYKCVRRVYKQNKKCGKKGHCKAKSSFQDITIKSIILKGYIEHITKEHIKIGAVISLENMFWFHVIRNTTQKLKWQHTVNDYKFNEVCKDPLPIRYPIHNRMKYQSPNCRACGNVVKCNFSMNICEKAFGLHKFAIIKATKDKRNETLYHPRQIMFLPQDMLIKQLPLKLLREENYLSLLQTKEQLEFKVNDIYIKICFLLVIILFNLIQQRTDTVCNFIFLVYDYLKGCSSRLGIPTILSILKKKHKYDVFMSCSDDDNSFVLQTIIPLLENQLNLKVCLPDRDIIPGQPLTEYSKCIHLSKRILVILSNSYVQDTLCNQMQFSMTIMPLLWSREKSLQDVLLLQYKHCDVPPIYSELLTVSNWVKHKDIRILKDDIEQWMENSESSTLSKFSEILLNNLAILMR